MLRNKTLPFLLLSLSLSLPAWSASPTNPDAPRGNFAELHSCELFAGSCVVSSEATQPDNYVLHVWKFEDGLIGNVPLKGLTVALLEKGDANLAARDTRADTALAYLPSGLSPAQREALLTWVRQNSTIKIGPDQVKTAKLEAVFTPTQTTFAAGKDVTFSGAPATACNVGGCGEMLWYEPRSAASSFAVDQLTQSRLIESALSAQWLDHGRRTLFVGRFGDPEPSVPPLCGAPTSGATALLGQN